MASELPQGAFLKSISATYNLRNLPRALRVMHALDAELWGQIVVDEGHILLCVGSESNVLTVTPDTPAIIPADTPFCIKLADVPVRFRILHYHEPVLRDATQLAELLSRKEA